MAKAKKFDIDYSKLSSAMKTSRWMLERFRANRRTMVRQMVGSNWSEEGAAERVPVNLIYQYVSIMARNTVPKNPRVMLSTFQKQAKPSVAAMMKWVNDEIVDRDLASVFQRIVVDAFFSLGIGLCALASPADSHIRGWNLKVGEPFLDRVDLDDFAFDPHARDFREVDFMCHRFRPTLESIRDNPMYMKARKDLTASTDSPYNQEGDERISMLGRGYKGNKEELIDKVDLWQVWVPSRKLILTLAADDGNGGMPDKDKPLLEQEWVGPDEGPYHILGFDCVPGNAMPIAPIPNIFDLHTFTNQTLRKLMRQTQRQKEAVAVRNGHTEDMDRWAQADDGGSFRCDDPDGLQIKMSGGPSPQNLAMFLQAKKLFDEMGGGISLLAGAGPQSPTATQDKLLNENAGAGVAGKQQDALKFISRSLKAMLWYWWHDPFNTRTVEDSLPGLPEMTFQRNVTPQQRQQLPWDKLVMRVDPYSMQAKTPQTRLMSIKGMVKDMIPLMPLLQQQGIFFDLNKFLEKCGEYDDEPDYGEMFAIQEPMGNEASGGGAPQQPGNPAETTRNYVRESRSQGTEEGNANNAINQMMTGNDQGGSRNGQTAGAM